MTPKANQEGGMYRHRPRLSSEFDIPEFEIDSRHCGDIDPDMVPLLSSWLPSSTALSLDARIGRVRH